MQPIGFSHGVLHKVHDINTKENIDIFKNCGSTAIEIKSHFIHEINLLDNIIPHLDDFEYISLHFPCNIRYANNPETRSVLHELKLYYDRLGARLAVIHPDTVDDWSVFDDYDFEFAIENMDDRKQNFKDVASLENFFQDNDNWKMVLDLGHCFVNDNTMQLAIDLKEKFKDRIKEIHLSGYEFFHDPLHRTQQAEIIKHCLDLDVPIIIESTFEVSDGIEGVRKEFDYILENLK